VGEIAPALVAGARECLRRIDLRQDRGSHPHVGALDVAPVVYLDRAGRGAACAEALVAGEELGREGLAVFLYGELAGGRTRAELRRGGLAGLAARVAAGEIAPDFGPAGAIDPRAGGSGPGALDPRAGGSGPGALDPRAGGSGPGAIDPRAGAVLVAARPPLVAFNVELAAPATLADARAIAAAIREGGPEGLPGVRALGLELPARVGVAQVSTNVEDHLAVPLARLVQAVARHADIVCCELVGLAPAAAFAGFPSDVEVRNRRTLEDALRV
jgi:glutamate formiminotransferase/glutamate formiminotransferase/formiminotetrahydrofolate cyclodeaminase